MPDFHRTSINDDSLIRGAARILYAGTTVAFPSNISQVINLSTYDAMSNWTDLGATKGGIAISVNNSEEDFDVDQIDSVLKVLPNGWEVNVSTALSEMTPERMIFAWEGSTVSTNAGQKVFGMGTPTTYIERRLAIAHQRANGKIRLYVMRKVIRAATESTIQFNKQGEQQMLPVRFRALPDLSIADLDTRFGVVFDQV